MSLKNRQRGGEPNSESTGLTDKETVHNTRTHPFSLPLTHTCKHTHTTETVILVNAHSAYQRPNIHPDYRATYDAGAVRPMSVELL